MPSLIIRSLFLFVVLGVFHASNVWAATPAYSLVEEKSSLKFIAIQNEAPVEGEFKEFTANIRFDPDNLDDSKIEVEVAVDSLYAGYDDLVKTLKLPEWLFVKKFPISKFSSKKITRLVSSDNYFTDGVLTLRDKKIPITLNFQITPLENDTVLAKGSTTLHRSDFGVGQGQWAKDDVIKDAVRVEFRIIAKKI